MKIMYVVPGTMSKSELGADELERRRQILQAHAGKGIKVHITDIEHGPISIESAYEEYLSIPETITKVVAAEKQGYAGVILGCFGDPGLDAMREMVRFPVAGPGECSLHVASMLGRRFSIVTVLSSIVPAMEKMARVVGLDRQLASVRATDIPVLELASRFEKSINTMMKEAEKARDEDGADVIILGCMSMAFMGVADMMSERLGIPVVNPVLVSLKCLEALIFSQLTHSKRAYPFPPKLEDNRE
jgi:allantoin racemase